MREIVRRLAYLLRQRRRDADLADEMAFHREMLERDLSARGLDASAARRAFGNDALARDEARDVWIRPWLQDAIGDLRFAMRLLGRNRRFTLVAVTVLGLGIGVDNALFIAVNATCLRGLPIPSADQVVQMAARDAQNRELPLSYNEFEEVRSASPAMAHIAAHATAIVSVGEEGRAPDRAVATFISATGFRILGEHPIVGRDFHEDDDRRGAPPVAILGNGLWKTRYGSDAAIIGRSIRVNGTPATVVGVMAEGFKFPNFAQLWQPLGAMPRLTTERRTARLLAPFARLADGSTLVEARQRLADLGMRLAHDHPETNKDIRLDAVPINEKYSYKISDPQWIMFLIIGAVIVAIACANVANLLLMRAAERRREMAIRASIGASRFRIVRQLLLESAALAALGGVVGGALSIAGGRLLTSLVPESQMPYWIRFTMDGRVFAALCIVCLGTVMLFGLAPALQASKADVIGPTKSGGYAVAGPPSGRWSTAFLAMEFALTMMLVANLISAERAGRAAARADVAFDPANVVTAWISLPADRYPTPDRRMDFFRRLHERFAALPNMSSVDFATSLPLGGALPRQLAIEGQELDTAGSSPTVWTVAISEDYFATIGVSLSRGRAFTERDGSAGGESAIVNERFAEMYFGTDSPIGRRIRLRDASTPGPPSPWLTIAGISPTIRQRSATDRDPIVYLPLRASAPATVVAMVRGPAEAAAAGPALRDAVRALDPDLPLYRVMSMEQALVDSQWAGRGSAKIINTIVLVALLFATAGLYAVTAHAVVQRTQEIGVRVALGARSIHVMRLVFDRAMRQVGLGVLIGLPFTFGWERLTVALFGNSAYYRMTDPITLLLVIVVLAAISAVASFAPTRRALALDPAVTLRHE